MFFNLFKKKNSSENIDAFVDIIYISNKDKANAILQLAKEKMNTIFIAWLEATQNHFKKIFEENNLNPDRVVMARNFHSASLQHNEIILLEHYPLLQKEIDFINIYQLNKLTVYSSLEEPIFKYFGGEKIISLMKSMGWKENESLIHPLISKSLKNAQRKIASKILVELPAHSQAEWMEKNLKK